MVKVDSLLLALGFLIGGIALYNYLLRPPTATVAPPSQEIQQKIWEQIEAPITPTPIPTPVTITNACGSTRFGYPDFTGTPREGSGCVDSLDCQQHPVPGHPEYQQCCTQDGTCFT